MDSDTDNAQDTSQSSDTALSDDHHSWIASAFGVDPRSCATDSPADNSAASAAPAASGGVLDSIGNAASSLANTVADTVDQATTQATDTASNMQSAVSTTLGDAADTASNAAHQAATQVSQAADSAQATLANAANSVAQDVTDLGANVTDSLSSTPADPGALTAGGDPNAVGAISPVPGGGLAAPVEFEIDAKIGKADLDYIQAEGTVTFTVTYEPADSSDASACIKLKNDQPECEAALKAKFGHDLTLKGGCKISGTKGEIGTELEIPVSASTKVTTTFEIVDIDTKKASVKFADVKTKSEYTLTEGTFEITGMKVKYSGKAAVEIAYEPKWDKLARYVADKFGVELTKDAIVDAAFTLSLAVLEIGVIAACAQAYIQLRNLAELKASLAAAQRSMNGGLLDGLSGKQSANTDPIYTQFWGFAREAFEKAAKVAVDQGLSMDDMDQEASYQASKAIKSWPQLHAADMALRDACFGKWVDQNHGIMTFHGDAHEAIWWCYGIEKEPDAGPHMQQWLAACKNG